MNWNQQRKGDLAQRLFESYKLLSNYEQELQWADNPQRIGKLEHQIEILKKQIALNLEEIDKIEQQLRSNEKQPSSEGKQYKAPDNQTKATSNLFYLRASAILRKILQHKTTTICGGLLIISGIGENLLQDKNLPINVSNTHIGIDSGTIPQNNQKPGIPSSTPYFGINLTACRATFDWDIYIKNANEYVIKKGGSVEGLPTSLIQKAPKPRVNQVPPSPDEIGKLDDIPTLNLSEKNKLVDKYSPYITQGCVRKKNFQPVNGAKYSTFDEGTAYTKKAFGNDPVLGIFQNGMFPAQGILGNENRAVISALPSIFTPEELKEIYSTGGARTGMPRIFSTGPDTFRTNADGKKIYRGGDCMVENGQIVVRTTHVGIPYDPSLRGKDPADPWHSCARQGKITVEDRNLEIMQFVYEFKYPTPEQCIGYNKAVNISETVEECIMFYRNAYGKNLVGDALSGNRIVYTETFYSTFNDHYTKQIGWINPDANGARKKSPSKFTQTFDGYSVFALD